jgi:SAM-dependent methyltransferase
MRWVWTEDLGAKSEHDANAVGYRATKARPLQKLIRKLNLHRDYVFIDLGSGKGRVLLVAAQLGFQNVVGVEFSPSLCNIARQNARVFLRNTKVASNIEVVQADAATFKMPSKECIFYAFNPFDGVVMERFIANLRESLQRHPRKVWFLYNTPLHATVLEKLFSSAEDFEIGGVEFKVYKNF